MTVVALSWVDAAFHGESDKTLAPIPALTFGLVWHKSPSEIMIASEVFADGTGRTFCVVPRQGGMGPKVIPVGKVTAPQTFLDYQIKLAPFLL